jgi:hypothetical protein
MNIFNYLDEVAKSIGTAIGEELSERIPAPIIALGFIIPIVAFLVWIWSL